MKKKLFISMAVALLSGVAFLPADIFAEDSSISSNPNVQALLAGENEVRCYENWSEDGKVVNCNPKQNNQPCALCDDDLVITPPPAGGDDGEPTRPPGG